VGYSGSQGYTGSKGDIGYSGSLGYTGSKGTDGVIGYNGSVGYTGSKGDIGYTGSLGYTGSGATGVNWTNKSATYTAVNTDGIIADTSGGSFTVTLPASPATGSYVVFIDGGNSFQTYPLTVAGNGSTIDGSYTSAVLNITNAKVEFIYSGSTWEMATSTGTRGYTGSLGYTGSVGYTGSLGYTGSGATGVNWTNKSTTYTAVNNDGIIANTSGGSFTVTLPASPSTGSYVVFLDGNSSFATYPLTVDGNGNNIADSYSTATLNITNSKVEFIYNGSTWEIATSTGTRGYSGSVGYTGSLGYTGSQGYTGSASTVIGYTGSKGDIGYTGSIPAAITATSLALGGATLGTNNLAVTGTASISGGAYISNLGGANKIINGDMAIDQRNAGASVTATDYGYTLDRWQTGVSQASKFTVQQSSTVPTTGYGFSLVATSLSAYAVLAGDIFRVSQPIEGFNTVDLQWGTANAQTVTISFWVRSSLTGAFGGSVSNNAQNRSYPFSYTINAANTWEQKTVTIAGDTTGTWVGATNGVGVRVNWGLGVGSTYSGTAGAWAGSQLYSVTSATSVVGTNGATWYVTGVKFEVGSIATPFVPDDYEVSFAKCQRYYETILNSNIYRIFGLQVTSTTANFYGTFQVSKRAAGSLVTVGSLSNLSSFNLIDSIATTLTTLVLGAGATATGYELAAGYTSATGNRSAVLYNSGSSITLAVSAEL
jgi:hypothetical protein